MADDLSFKMAAKLAKFVLKSAVAGGLIYVAVNITNIRWITPNYSIPDRDNRMFVQELIPSNDIFKEKWNNGVQKLFHGLLVVPETARELSESAFDKIKNSYKTSDK